MEMMTSHGKFEICTGEIGGVGKIGRRRNLGDARNDKIGIGAVPALSYYFSSTRKCSTAGKDDRFHILSYCAFDNVQLNDIGFRRLSISLM